MFDRCLQYLFALTLLAGLTLAGCGGEPPSEPHTPAPGLAPQPPAPSGQPAAPVSPPESQEQGQAAAESPEAAPGLDPLHQKLLGTKWRINDIEVAFIAPDKVFVQGGALTQFYPDGTEARYTYNDGAVVVSVMGQSTGAQWDGERLLVNGMPAQAVPAEDAPETAQEQ